MSPDVIQSQIADIQALLTSQMRIRGRTFADQLRRAKRQLPRGVRRHANYLLEAQKLASHPKLARMINFQEATRAHKDVTDYLKTLDPAAQRIDRVLGVMSVIAVNILLIAAAIIIYLVWTGRV